MLSLLASILYLATAALSGLAAFSRGKGRDRSPSSRRSWLFIAAFFVVLAAMRLGGAEDAMREFFRGWLMADGEYASRRSIQGPIVAAVLCALIGVAIWARRTSARGRGAPIGDTIRWARWGAAAMAVLIVLRLISFHPIDILLYRRLHLNWIVDIGSTLLVIACAIAWLRDPSGTRRNARTSAARRDRRPAAAPPADPS